MSMSRATLQPMPTKDGHIIACAATDDQWERMCQAMGKPEWIKQYPTPAERASHVQEIIDGINLLFPQKTSQEWLAIFEAADVPCGPVYTFAEALKDPQLAVNQTFVEYDHPVAGRVRGVNVPGKFSATPTEIRHPAPSLGEHTIEVLSEFGFGQTEIARLLAAKAGSQGQRPHENGLAQAATVR
ncbi:MAG: CoA transferase [Deltaproteobacteria bacterium]|nr:CoA transferase [Deltaproteobacteria bacterium]